ncbi:MAG: DEAD/DEAH box helicase family protein [Polyangiales bacterium]
MRHAFELVSELAPKGDQPRAINELLSGLEVGEKHQCLLGITGSGKTFSVANVIAKANRPALVMAPNKTLAAQLYQELKELFPNNAVEYFVSYYDYYQPEAYIPTTDTFIEKDAIINDDIDRMRHAATHSLLSRRDVIIVASVSCIYGIGSAEWYQEMVVELEPGKEILRDRLLRQLVDIQYDRNDVDLPPRDLQCAATVEVSPAHADKTAIRIEYFGDEIERLTEIDPPAAPCFASLDRYAIYPGSHYVTPEEQRAKAIIWIRAELRERLEELQDVRASCPSGSASSNARRSTSRCSSRSGIAKASRTTRATSAVERPASRRRRSSTTSRDFTILDESHQTIPADRRMMFRGDRARKKCSSRTVSVCLRRWTTARSPSRSGRRT